MERITFRQFINTFNFRDFYEEHEDTKIIRINLYLLRNLCCARDYIEFGVYDFDGGKRQRIEYVFSEAILESYVDSIGFVPNMDNLLEIYLTNEKEEEEC